MRADERLDPQVIEQIREAIRDAGGNEVFLVGRAGEEGKICSVTVGARGTEQAVPVLGPHLEGADAVIHNHPSGGVRPSNADLAVAARLGNQGIGFYIVDNDVEEIYVVAEPVETRETVPLDEEELAGGLSPGGALARVYPLYEERESQTRMLRQVARAFNRDEICAAEAGTGVGKSLAYLVPAVAWAVQNGERVIVSTNTINLQQQLMEKDIPLAKKVLGQDPKVVLVKGRGNYLCLHRLNEALEEMGLFEEQDPELLSIREWARTTETGSRTDLSFYPTDEGWSRVCSEADTCLGLRCTHREGCFILKARREASSARILIANHHLLFADLALRLEGSGFDDPAVLPPFRRVVFDEAHNVEKAATSFFSQASSRFTILRHLNRLYRRRKGRVTGHLPALLRGMGRSTHARKLPGLVQAVADRASELDRVLLDVLGDEPSVLLDPPGLSRLRDQCGAEMGNVVIAIRELADAGADLLESREGAGEAGAATTAIAEDGGAPGEPGKEGVELDCRLQLGRLSAIADMIDRFRMGEAGENDIFWMERVRSSRRGRGDQGQGTSAGLPGEQDDTRDSVKLTITPLDVGPLMREAVYEPLKTVVFTSATLTVAGDFSFWAGRIGLGRSAASSSPASDREPVLKTFPSPFDYREHVLLGVPTDAPAPDAPGHREFLSRFLARSLEASRGGGLVLFTSYALLKEMYAAVQPALAATGIRLMRQGDSDRARLLDAFRAERSSVLFATDSFWEGVDAPGDTLRIVVVTRLPFRVPSEPVLRARMTSIEERGGNPFGELSLPDAVVRMRQGFGRLMRRHDDSGVVLILDPRVVTKSYGSVFLESLPDARRVLAPAAEVLREVAAFFRRA
ncbi:MAG TPA: helicase C-terminal domain-containing protein [Spirochaetia bacterium]|nr:helicase C-terminal domain-containing protein [Spirochaetia bacterium]